jgi:hypothetical protein
VRVIGGSERYVDAHMRLVTVPYRRSRTDATQRAARDDPLDSSRSNRVDTASYPTAMDQDVPEWGKDYGSKSKKGKLGKSKKNTGPVYNDGGLGRSDSYGSGGRGGTDEWSSGGARRGEERYGNGNGNGNGGTAGAGKKPVANGEPNWDHEF